MTESGANTKGRYRGRGGAPSDGGQLDPDKNLVASGLLLSLAAGFVALTEGWIAADGGGRLSDGDGFQVVPVLALDYGVDDLVARVLLRLGPDGRLATSRDDNPMQLALDVRVGRRETGVISTAAISPPDFLARGRLHEAFGELVRSEQVNGLLRGALTDTTITAEVVDPFLRSVRSGWVVFRVAQRATHDTDVILWQGDLKRRPHLLVLRVDVVVDVDGPEPAVRLADAPRLQARPVRLADAPRLQARLVPTDGDRIDVVEDEAGYFARLLHEIYRWRQLVR